MRRDEWQAALVVLGSYAALMLILECLMRRLSPPPSEDPRLGIVMFWIWAVGVGGLTYGLWPALSTADRPLEWLVYTPALLVWLAWKLGVVERWEDTPREREEIWATTVGVFMAFLLLEIRP